MYTLIDIDKRNPKIVAYGRYFEWQVSSVERVQKRTKLVKFAILCFHQSEKRTHDMCVCGERNIYIYGI